VEQGVAMGRPSLIDIKADVNDGVITEVRVGGESVIVSEGHLIVS
jgi:trans-2,3-dihydro-3-hydroxyanthranilate isomerase